MKRLSLVLSTVVVIMVLSGCGSDNKYSGNYGGVSGANASGTTTSNSIYTNGEEDQELKDTLLIDLLGNPESTPTDSDTTETITPPTSTTDTTDTFKTKNAGYIADTNSLPVCFNTEETILEYSGTPRFTCEWYCGIYDGDGPIHVKLTFLKENSIWTLTDEDLSTASSQCHN